VKLFEKHGMTNVVYFVPQDVPRQNTLICVLSHKDRETAKQSWDEFRKDRVGESENRIGSERGAYHGRVGVHGSTGFQDEKRGTSSQGRLPIMKRLLLCARCSVSGPSWD
jgi:hypothetical protein